MAQGKNRKDKSFEKRLRHEMSLRQVNKAILISLKNRFVYLRIPKVANSSIKHLIYRMESMAGDATLRDDMIHDIHYGPVVRPHMLGFNSALLQQALCSDDFFRFTIVRNPYAKALSNYLDRYMATHGTVRRQINRMAFDKGWISDRGTTADFSTYLQSATCMPLKQMDIHISPQYVQALVNIVEFDYVGSFETLSEDLSAIAGRIWGRTDIDLGFHSPAKTDAAAKLREAYSEATIAMVNEVYAKDFEVFGYPRVDKPEELSDPDALLRDTSVTPAPSAQPAG